jgi:cytochrome c peroxidase
VRLPQRFGACLFGILVAGAVSAPAIDVATPSATPAPALSPGSISALPPMPQADPAKVALGEALFADTHLSADGTRACTTCHDVKTNGAGHGRFDTATDGQPMPFNTLTVFNAALNFRLGWLGNTRTLEAQAEASLNNPRTMGTDVARTVTSLRDDPQFASRFNTVFGHRPDRTSLLDALATYERSLLTPGSRFDRWLEGDASAISTGELEGYRLFESLGCSSCHQGVNVGGNLFERQGIFRPLVKGQPETVRVPSLRNVATTAPYFHDGSAATLEDAVKRMAAAQLDRTLTDQQVESIVAFLRTLTGNFRGSPVTEGAP